MVNLKQNDLRRTVTDEFPQNAVAADLRWKSFDYCYHYFLRTDLAKADPEKSCSALGWYLASWGLLRPAPFAKDENCRYLPAIVNYIAGQDKKIWRLDVDRYTDENIAEILAIHGEIQAIIRRTTGQEAGVARTTKILLGVFGFVPALDSRFVTTFRNIFRNREAFSRLDEETLKLLRDFYQANQADINKLSGEFFTYDFLKDKPTGAQYPKIRIIDMYGYAKSARPRRQPAWSAN
ncbi:MAG: hypothetical protein LBK71_04005 [Verrucomicrobiales bacterium]|jgi:hypothetical protein|nr:hypothetical protein [Verrucomicrobiales bacterium]